MHAATKILLILLILPSVAIARNPIRSEFFSNYPNALATQLDALPSDSKHCGVCHFDFGGGGTRNPYGLAIEIGLNNGLSNQQAILAIELDDSDQDGFSNLVEITNLNFGNTPTFPGLTIGNVGLTSQIPLIEIEGFLTPTAGTDSIPPVVTVLSPNGGESYDAATQPSVLWSATDASGIAHVDVDLSDDGGVTWKPIARTEPATGSLVWFVPNLPSGNSRIRVTAFDNAGNPGSDASDTDFTVTAVTGGIVPTTLRDLELPGTQPFEGAILDNPENCLTCHAGYDPENEPGETWAGSMMAQAMRDPLFLAAVAIAEQDAPSSGDMCIRCHTPGGWQEGRSVDTSGGLLNAKDLHGVQCDFCHRAVDPFYVNGSSPLEDVDILATVSPLPLQNGNGQFITDPAPIRRGPYADAQASHAFLESPYHRSSDQCGTCHDVSNPVFVQTAPGDYVPNGFDAPHPDMDLRNMFPVERTFSEWSRSEYASTGVFAPQFAGNKPDGIVSSCQDCHMPDANAQGSNISGSPTRPDMPRHDLVGGNAFIPDVLPALFPGELNETALQSTKTKAISMLQRAATLSVTSEDFGVVVRVTNETGHKLFSGYPEGRRIWLHVEGFDAGHASVFESGAYDAVTATLHHDNQVKIYEIKPGLSPGLAQALGLPAGPSFHFVLNDTIYSDNRIPPRGFTNAAFEEIQSPPVAYPYADGQYWDDTPYSLPVETDSVVVSLYYQTVSKEYIEFLRDANTSDSSGDILYNAWDTHGKSTPVLMAQLTTSVTVIPSDIEPPEERRSFGIQSIRASGGSDIVEMTIEVPELAYTSVRIFDVRGHRIGTLVDGILNPGKHELSWNSLDSQGRRVASGIYFLNLSSNQRTATEKIVIVR